MLEARTITVSIACPLDRAYAATWPPETFPRWAAGLSSSLHREGDAWVADTPAGKATITFSEKNAYGVLDHRVQLPGLPEVHVPMRMVANGDGTEVVFTLFRQPNMDDAAFASDQAHVEKDLATLKALLEGQASTA